MRQGSFPQSSDGQSVLLSAQIVFQPGVSVGRHRVVQIGIDQAKPLRLFPCVGDPVMHGLDACRSIHNGGVLPVCGRLRDRRYTSERYAVRPITPWSARLILRNDALVGRVTMRYPVSVAIQVLRIADRGRE